ncbi:MAG: SDR family oxidoreductase [Firmicutes bacterium]|nr:SDR family oxidoreductase [Bacillota bacterium]
MECSDRNERIILTGATGFLGRQVLRLLQKKLPSANFCLLLRKKPGYDKDISLSAPPENHGDKEEIAEKNTRVRRVYMDITGEYLGLSKEEYRNLFTGATRIIHMAASVHFDQPMEEARRINVSGTKNILKLAHDTASAGSLKSFMYTSTAFVTGTRTGLVMENDIDAGQAFRNSYEKTKFEAEKLVRKSAEALPITIVRPSIIVGDSNTGITTSFKTIYWPLRIYTKTIWRFVPGFPDGIIDIVPVNFVAESIAHLCFDSDAAGNCFHLCAGPEGNITLEEIANLASRFFKLPPPRFVNPAFFDLAFRPFMSFLPGKKRHLLHTLRQYRPYFRVKTIFDTANACKFLEPAGIAPPRVTDYIEKIFRYCVKSDWGKKPFRE